MMRIGDFTREAQNLYVRVKSAQSWSVHAVNGYKKTLLEAVPRLESA